ncbi:MAG: PAAR-like domain-containing protein [Anaerolineales bacterium]
MSIFGVMTSGGGSCMAAPDVCMTPGVSAGAPGPLPYPNSAQCAQGSGSSKVKVQSSQTLRKGDKISMSSGDEAGNAPGGQMSGQFKGPVEVKRGCAKVKVEGKQIGFHTTTTGHNGNNANAPMGTHMSPSQMKVKCSG